MAPVAPGDGDDVEKGEGGGVAAKAADKAKEKTTSWLEGKDGGEGLAESLGGSDSFMFRALALIVPLEYIAWYTSVIAFSIGFGVRSGTEGELISGMEPFNHIDFTPIVEGGEWQPLVNWLSTVVTLLVATPWIVYFVCRPAKRATDCSVAMQALHFFLATTATQQTPENWVWWATVMPCFVIMGRTAEFMIEIMPPKRRRGRRGGPTTPYTKTG